MHLGPLVSLTKQAPIWYILFTVKIYIVPKCKSISPSNSIASKIHTLKLFNHPKLPNKPYHSSFGVQLYTWCSIFYSA